MATMYNAGAGTRVALEQANLVCWFHMDEGIGTDILDYSATANNGTTNGHTWINDGVIYDGTTSVTTQYILDLVNGTFNGVLI